MTISLDDDFAAAEYALGTLDASERATLAARRLREPDLDEAILAWEERLAPLAEAAPEVEPPRDLLPAIEARIRGASPEAPGSEAIVELERSIRRWRAMAIAASLFAGVLAIGFVARETSRQTAPREYVAILQKDAAYLRRDLGYDALRNRAADLRRMQPRTTRIADELAETEAALLAWRASPPPVDLSQAEEARQRANKAADVRLDRELKAIRARVRSGELDGEE